MTDLDPVRTTIALVMAVVVGGLALFEQFAALPGAIAAALAAYWITASPRPRRLRRRVTERR